MKRHVRPFAPRPAHAAAHAATPGGAVKLDQIRPEAAVDLGEKGWIKEARTKRARAEYADAVKIEVARLTRRVSWLTRKAARLPIRHRCDGRVVPSNGKAKAQTEAAQLQALATMLPLALSAKRTVIIPEHGSRHMQRAIRLLNEIAAVA